MKRTRMRIPVPGGGREVAHPETDGYQVIGYPYRRNLTTYVVGDIAYSENIPSWGRLQCTQAGTTAATEPTLPQTAGSTVTDGSVVWELKDIRNGGGTGDLSVVELTQSEYDQLSDNDKNDPTKMYVITDANPKTIIDSNPVGTIIAYAANGSNPVGYLNCDGSAVSRTMYPDLFSAIGVTYGEGNGSTTFNLPNMIGKYPQGDTTAGTVKEAGLPNITGNINQNVQQSAGAGNFDGAFSGEILYSAILGTGNICESAKVDFDASKSNPIYGNSDTVTPPTLTVRYIIKAFDGQTANSALVDVTQYAQELNNKVSKTELSALFPDSADAHNSIYRGKDLTEYFESGAMSVAIANGSFSDIYIGDYITKSVTVNGTTYSNAKWLVAGLDSYLHSGDTETTAHHVVLIPDSTLQRNVYMNSSNVTTGGYVGSYMWATVMPLWKTGVQNAFGSSHVLSHRELLTNAVSNGASSNWAWTDVWVNIPNENMVYGGRVWSSSAYDVGSWPRILPLYLFKDRHLDDRSWFWLRSVYSASGFCTAGYGGNAGVTSASHSSADGGVRPYFLLV